MITCHFIAKKPVGRLRLDVLETPLQGHLLLRLIAVLIPQQRPSRYHARHAVPTLWPTNYWHARRRWRGQYGVINRT